jgi:hypothetical protein
MNLPLPDLAAVHRSGPRLPQALLGLLLPLLITVPVAARSAPPVPALPVTRTWQPGPVYMQIGPSCVGYALAAWLDAAPAPVATHASGWQIYQAARAQDGLAGPHDGTTMEAGFAVLARLGYVRDWQATSNPARALAFLRTDGPIVILSDFPDGLAVLDGAGNLVWTNHQSRHGWLCYSVDAGDRLGCQNSASSGWNAREGGRFHMTWGSLVTVLAHGRAWLPHKAERSPKV